MADEEKVDEPLLVEEEEVVAEATEIVEEVAKVNSVEEQALAKGWKKKEDFDGDPALWRDASTFIEKGELFDTIHSLKRKAKEQDELLEKLVAHNKEVEELSYKKALERIKAEHRAAVELGDVAKAEELTGKIVDMATAKTPSAPEVHPDIAEFLDRHKAWFYDPAPEHAAMAVFADKLQSKIAGENPSMSVKETLDRVEATLRKKFPHEFRGSVGGSSAVAAQRPVTAKPALSIESLDKGQQDFIHMMKRRYKDFDVKNYIKQMKELEEGN